MIALDYPEVPTFHPQDKILVSNCSWGTGHQDRGVIMRSCASETLVEGWALRCCGGKCPRDARHMLCPCSPTGESGVCIRRRSSSWKVDRRPIGTQDTFDHYGLRGSIRCNASHHSTPLLSSPSFRVRCSLTFPLERSRLSQIPPAPAV